jgi:RimJ/RimL family protein N-acetyltransferase
MRKDKIWGSEMIKLDLIEKEDLHKIIEWNVNKSSDDLLQWAGPKFNYPLTLDQIENYFLNEVKNGELNIFIYKILLIDTGEMIGTIELRETDKDNKIGRICRFLIGEEKYRGKNIGATVLNKVLEIGFQSMRFEKITLGVFDFNNGAIRCYEKAGFVKENFIENRSKSSTGYWNLYEMGISITKWQIKMNNL